MKYIIDLTNENFDRIDFTEAKIVDLFCQHNLPSELEFTVWGANLLLSPMWNHKEQFDDSLPKTNDMYVSGIGKVKISGLVGGYIEVYAYDNIRETNEIDTAKNRDGSDLVFKRTWNFDANQNVTEYLWECVIVFPYGFCNLRLYVHDGNVSYEFDSDDLITVDEYLNNPNLHSFKE